MYVCLPLPAFEVNMTPQESKLVELFDRQCPSCSARCSAPGTAENLFSWDSCEGLSTLSLAWFRSKFVMMARRASSERR